MRALTPPFFALTLWSMTFAYGAASTMVDGQAAKQVPSTGKLMPHPPQASPLPITATVPSTLRASLPDLAREAVAIHFHGSRYMSLEELIQATPVCKEYKRSSGLFVTLSKNGQTRACWGSIYPQNEDLVKATILTTEAALTKEYRFPHVRASEWRSLKPQVTIVRDLQPISSMSGQNPLHFGLLVRSGSRGAVLLPGEAADAHYQLVKCKLKAAIPVNQPCQLYRIRADVLK